MAFFPLLKLLCLTVLQFTIIHVQTSDGKKNILFLVSDDMRPQLGAYAGSDFPSPIHPKMSTPNLDALASQSLLLKKAYVQQAVCSPSRTSLLTGRRPDTTHVYDLVHYFRQVGGNFTTIPQYFKENGYASIGMGKIFHPGSASDHDDPISWTEPYFHANSSYWPRLLHTHSWLAVDRQTRQQHPLIDDQVAQHAIEVLQRVAPQAKAGNKPFFVGVGFHKPHLPFVFPEEFLNLYPEENIRLPENEYAPVNMPKVAWSNWYSEEMRAYDDIRRLNASGAINSTLPPQVVKNLRRAYYSALSYTDSLIGLVLRELENLGLADNTIVSFWGDHGWQLGEHGEWCKHTNFELATHAPMMVKVPGLTDKGIITEELTEFVDLFPTLVEAAGFPSMNICPPNSSNIKLCREGNSLMPLIRNASSIKWKSRVFSQYPRDNYKVMGYSMRTDKYRYTEWVQFHGRPLYKPDWDKLVGVELYDHTNDKEENYNRAYDPSFRTLRQELSRELRAGWRQAQSPDPK